MTQPDPLLLEVLQGLVPLHIAQQATTPQHDQATAALRHADTIAAYGDRLTAPGNFQDPDDRRARGRLLTAMAAALAHGAAQPGGITWCGAHWCTSPHPACPNVERSAA